MGRTLASKGQNNHNNHNNDNMVLSPRTHSIGSHSSHSSHSRHSHTSHTYVWKRVVKYSEAPEFYKWNEFITSGYRPKLTVTECLYSMFQFHNETLNIWTHLFAAVAFVLLIFLTLNHFPIEHWYDKLVLSSYLLLNLSCFVFSTLYHLFICHSPGACYRFRQLDFMGIAFAILGSFLPSINYAFRCHPISRFFYLSFTIFSALLLALAHALPKFNTDAFERVRVSLFAGMALFGFVPLLHWASISETEEISHFLPKVLTMYALYGAGLFFYISRYPERLGAGFFDIWFHSHQLWHVFVFAASTYFYFCSLEFYEYTKRSYCPVTDFNLPLSFLFTP